MNRFENKFKMTGIIGFFAVICWMVPLVVLISNFYEYVKRRMPSQNMEWDNFFYREFVGTIVIFSALGFAILLLGISSYYYLQYGNQKNEKSIRKAAILNGIFWLLFSLVPAFFIFLITIDD